MAKTDAKYDDIPYKSPSNESLQADSAVLKDGTEIYLGPDAAAYLNGQGVVIHLILMLRIPLFLYVVCSTGYLIH